MIPTRGTLLITGGAGLLGINWARYCAGSWRLVLTRNRRKVSPDFGEVLPLPLSDPDAIARALDRIEPQMVVHTAGMTSVEQCEADPEGARSANVEAPANLAAACDARGIKLISISTDHLFDTREPMIPETAECRPLNVYAHTKADGEKAVLDACPDAIVARTNFFCWGTSYRHSFSDWIIGSLRAGRRVRLYADVYFTPVLADELARAVHELADLGAAGIYNVASDTRLSKHEFGHRVASQFGLNASLIDEGLLTDHVSPAARPREMSLSNAKLTEKLGRPIGDVDSHLRVLAEQEQRPDITKVQAL